VNINFYFKLDGTATGNYCGKGKFGGITYQHTLVVNDMCI